MFKTFVRKDDGSCWTLLGYELLSYGLVWYWLCLKSKDEVHENAGKFTS